MNENIDPDPEEQEARIEALERHNRALQAGMASFTVQLDDAYRRGEHRGIALGWYRCLEFYDLSPAESPPVRADSRRHLKSVPGLAAFAALPALVRHLMVREGARNAAINLGGLIGKSTVAAGVTVAAAGVATVTAGVVALTPVSPFATQPASAASSSAAWPGQGEPPAERVSPAPAGGAASQMPAAAPAEPPSALTGASVQTVGPPVPAPVLAVPAPTAPAPAPATSPPAAPTTTPAAAAPAPAVIPSSSPPSSPAPTGSGSPSPTDTGSPAPTATGSPAPTDTSEDGTPAT